MSEFPPDGPDDNLEDLEYEFALAYLNAWYEDIAETEPLRRLLSEHTACLAMAAAEERLPGLTEAKRGNAEFAARKLACMFGEEGATIYAHQISDWLAEIYAAEQGDATAAVGRFDAYVTYAFQFRDVVHGQVGDQRWQQLPPPTRLELVREEMRRAERGE